MSHVYRDALVREFDRECRVTRDVLSRVPQQHWAWKPHEKSMTLGQLAGHIATMNDWLLLTLIEPGLSFQKPPKLPKFESVAPMLEHWDNMTGKCRAAMANIDDAAMADAWAVSNDGQAVHTDTRLHLLRIWSLNHTIHHRGQLNLYLRLLDVPVAKIYFNTADDKAMAWE